MERQKEKKNRIEKTILYMKYTSDLNSLKLKYSKLGLSNIEILGIDEFDKICRIVNAERLATTSKMNSEIQNIKKKV